MNEELELDQRPFFQIIHAMIREDATEPEQERTSRVMEWVQKSRFTIERVCLPDEMALFAFILGYFHQYKSTPTRETCTQIVISKQKPKVVLDLLDQYDKQVGDLRKLSHLDLDIQLDQRKSDYEVRRLLAILGDAKMITLGSVLNPKGKDLPQLSGTRDAIAHLTQKIHSVLIETALAPTVASMTEADEADYAQRKEEAQSGKGVIKTGIGPIDECFGGLSRGELNGILGYVGSRKSATCRTIAYNAARAGHKVIYIPLESSAMEERAAQTLIHAHVLNPKSTITIKRMLNGTLSEDEETIVAQVRRDLNVHVGRNLSIVDLGSDRTWINIKRIIETHAYGASPVDLVIIDYLTLVSIPPETRDKVSAMEAIIKDAKQLTLTAGGGRKVSIITPIQGNRKGLDDAAEKDGLWDITGISLYSEYDKSLDNCFGVYTTPELNNSGKLKICSCKARRGSDLPATFVSINPATGLIHGDEVKVNVRRSAPPVVPAKDDYFFSYMAH